MSAYRVYVANPAKRDIKKLERQAVLQVVRAIEDLGVEPFPVGVEKLQGRPAYLRIRTGNFRIIYSVKRAERVVIVLVARDRKDAFKGLDQLDAKLADAILKMADSIDERIIFTTTASLATG